MRCIVVFVSAVFFLAITSFAQSKIEVEDLAHHPLDTEFSSGGQIDLYIRSAKIQIVGSDERESAERALLNFGHTFGHALEAATGFSDRLFHGEGVAIGMVLAAELSARLGMISPADAARVECHLAEVGLPTHLRNIAGFAQEGLADADALMALMAQDKKVRRGRLTFILLEAVGRAVVSRDVEPALVRDFLKAKLAESA